MKAELVDRQGEEVGGRDRADGRASRCLVLRTWDACISGRADSAARDRLRTTSDRAIGKTRRARQRSARRVDWFHRREEPLCAISWAPGGWAEQEDRSQAHALENFRELIGKPAGGKFLRAGEGKLERGIRCGAAHFDRGHGRTTAASWACAAKLKTNGPGTRRPGATGERGGAAGGRARATRRVRVSRGALPPKLRGEARPASKLREPRHVRVGCEAVTATLLPKCRARVPPEFF